MARKDGAERQEDDGSRWSAGHHRVIEEKGERAFSMISA